MLNPFVMTKLMVNARRAPLTRTPADVGLEFESVSFPAGDGVGLKGWFIASGEAEPSPAVVFVHGWLWNRHGNIADQVKGPRTSTSTSCRRRRACTTRATTCCSSTCAATGRASAAASCRSPTGATRRATTGRARATCARGRTSTRSGSARSAARWAPTSSSTARPRPAGQGDPRHPADAGRALQPQLHADEIGRLGPPMLEADGPRSTPRWRAPLAGNHDPAVPAAQARRHGRPVRAGHGRPVGRDGRRRGHSVGDPGLAGR